MWTNSEAGYAHGGFDAQRIENTAMHFGSTSQPCWTAGHARCRHGMDVGGACAMSRSRIEHGNDEMEGNEFEIPSANDPLTLSHERRQSAKRQGGDIGNELFQRTTQIRPLQGRDSWPKDRQRPEEYEGETRRVEIQARVLARLIHLSSWESSREARRR